MRPDQNIITLQGQEGTEVATLTPLQAAIQPVVPEMILFWWAVWISVFMYMTVRFLILPKLQK